MSEFYNPPAFPVVAENGLGHINEGMTLRDYFAGQVLGAVFMSGIKGSDGKAVAKHIAQDCYLMAEAMLYARCPSIDGEA